MQEQARTNRTKIWSVLCDIYMNWGFPILFFMSGVLCIIGIVVLWPIAILMILAAACSRRR